MRVQDEWLNMNIPKSLYRFFDKKKYRNQFLKGLIRFGRLEVYKEIEDQRKDVDEGEPRGIYKTDRMIVLNIGKETGKATGGEYKKGEVNISGYSPNSFFIVAMSDEKANLEFLSKKFGKYAVKINDVEKLLDLLNQNCKVSWKAGKILLAQVRYDKDGYITIGKDNHLPFEYYFAQKAESFAQEYEWRIVLTGSGIDKTDEKVVFIEIGSLDEVASKVDF